MSSSDDESDPEEEMDKLMASSTSVASPSPDFSDSFAVPTFPVNFGEKIWVKFCPRS